MANISAGVHIGTTRGVRLHLGLGRLSRCLTLDHTWLHLGGSHPLCSEWTLTCLVSLTHVLAVNQSYLPQSMKSAPKPNMPAPHVHLPARTQACVNEAIDALMEKSSAVQQHKTHSTHSSGGTSLLSVVVPVVVVAGEWRHVTLGNATTRIAVKACSV